MGATGFDPTRLGRKVRNYQILPSIEACSSLCLIYVECAWIHYSGGICYMGHFRAYNLGSYFIPNYYLIKNFSRISHYLLYYLFLMILNFRLFCCFHWLSGCSDMFRNPYYYSINSQPKKPSYHYRWWRGKVFGLWTKSLQSHLLYLGSVQS